ncbi:HAD-IA family hydrolase [Shewanella mesophila]|nr:HAD-IA family hydrolase [Shewanella mesophila]
MQLFNNTFKGVIFDLDGTLVSSSLDFTALKLAIACPLDRDILTFIDSLPVAQARSAIDIIEQAELIDANSATRLNGTLALLDFLLLQQIPMAIVTRNSHLAAKIKIDRNELPIELVYTRDDGPAKPDPTCLNRIAELWQIEPDKIAYVGDHFYDVEAANRAGMRSVLLNFDSPRDHQHQADFVFRDLQQLLHAIPSISLCA